MGTTHGNGEKAGGKTAGMEFTTAVLPWGWGQLFAVIPQ